MDRDKIITGQIFVRDTSRPGEKAPDGSDRRLVMVVGILAIPWDTPWKGEHQYTVTGPGLYSGEEITSLTVHNLSGIDRGNPGPEEMTSKGSTLGALLTEPWWRC